MFKNATFWFTLFAVLLSLYHATGLDHDDTVFMMFSPAAWILPIFIHLNRYDPLFVYTMTVLIWFFAGRALDRYVAKYRA